MPEFSMNFSLTTLLLMIFIVVYTDRLGLWTKPKVCQSVLFIVISEFSSSSAHHTTWSWSHMTLIHSHSWAHSPAAAVILRLIDRWIHISPTGLVFVWMMSFSMIFDWLQQLSYDLSFWETEWVLACPWFLVWHQQKTSKVAVDRPVGILGYYDVILYSNTVKKFTVQ